jgi:aminopeptidase N
MWLNEGFATYAEWLWEEYEGRGTTQELLQPNYDAIPAEDPFWAVVIGDPGVDLLFDDAVYVRGAMTLQAPRNEVGDKSFWAIVRGWATTKSGRNAATEEFIAHAEEVSGQQLDELFQTPRKPDASAVSPSGRADLSNGRARARAKAKLGQLQRRLALGRY